MSRTAWQATERDRARDVGKGERREREGPAGGMEGREGRRERDV